MAKNVYVGVNADLKLTDTHQYSIDEMISAGYATADSTWVACSGINDFAVYYAPSGVLCLWATPRDNGDGELYIYSTDYLRTGIGYYVRADKWAAGSLPPPGGGSAALEAWFVQGGVATRYYPGTEARARKVKKMYVGVECKAPIGREITYDALLSTLSSVSLSGYSTTVAVIDKDKTKWIPEPSNPNLMPVWITETKDISSAEAGTYFTFIPRGGQLLTGEMNYVALAWKCIRQGSNAVYEEYTVGTTQVARRIKKAYIGVGGVARPCFGHDPIEYYGTVTPLSDARQYLMGGSVGNYAVFAGGQKSYTDQTTVYAYDASLTLTTPTALSAVPNGSTNAPSVGDYVLFGPLGETGSGNNPSIMNAYNASLTRSTPTSLSQGRVTPGQAHLGTAYALVAGGGYGNGGSTSSTRVDAYNTSLTRTTVTALSVGRQYACGVSGDNYVLMAGGDAIVSNQVVFYSTVDAYNNTLVRSIPTTLSVARQHACGVSVGGYMLVIGGSRSNATYSTIDAYNNSLTRSTPISLSVARDSILGTNLGRYAILLGGRSGSSFTWEKIAEMYTTTLVRKTLPSMSIARARGAIANAGNYTLVAGNYSSGTKVVEAYAYYPDA